MTPSSSSQSLTSAWLEWTVIYIYWKQQVCGSLCTFYSKCTVRQAVMKCHCWLLLQWPVMSLMPPSGIIRSDDCVFSSLLGWRTVDYDSISIYYCYDDDIRDCNINNIWLVENEYAINLKPWWDDIWWVITVWTNILFIISFKSFSLPFSSSAADRRMQHVNLSLLWLVGGGCPTSSPVCSDWIQKEPERLSGSRFLQTLHDQKPPL